MIGGSEPLLAVAGLLVAFAGLAPTLAEGAGFVDGTGPLTWDAAGFAASVFATTFTCCGWVERLAAWLASATLPCPDSA